MELVGYQLENDDGPLFVTVETALVDVFTKLAGIINVTAMTSY